MTKSIWGRSAFAVTATAVLATVPILFAERPATAQASDDTEEALQGSVDETYLAWAYPVGPNPSGPGQQVGDKEVPSAPLGNDRRNGVLASYTGLPLMPEVVYAGKPRSCMQCHLGDGHSHPESADIGGLPVQYLIDQMYAYRNEERLDYRTGTMVAAAKAASDEDIRESAEYYASIPRWRQKVVDTVVSYEAPEHVTTFGQGGISFALPDGGMVPIPEGRIITMATDPGLNRARDLIRGKFTQYVRPDDFEIGKRAVAEGNCASCHGSDFRGVGDTPRIASRHAPYFIRSVANIRSGRNKTAGATAVRAEHSVLSDREIVGAAAYLASLEP